MSAISIRLNFVECIPHTVVFWCRCLETKEFLHFPMATICFGGLARSLVHLAQYEFIHHLTLLHKVCMKFRLLWRTRLYQLFIHFGYFRCLDSSLHFIREMLHATFSSKVGCVTGNPSPFICVICMPPWEAGEDGIKVHTHSVNAQKHLQPQLPSPVSLSVAK